VKSFFIKIVSLDVEMNMIDMTTVKLFYYQQASGRGHQIRLVLAAGNISFEDVLATFPLSKEQNKEWKISEETQPPMSPCWRQVL